MQLPCPNPVCTHVFSQAEVARANALKCPRCGHEFRLRSEPAAPQQAARPAASPIQAKPAAPPMAKPVQPRPAAAAMVAAGPSAHPFADAPSPKPAPVEDQSNIDFGPPTSLIRRAKGPRKPPKVWKKYVVFSFLGLVMIGAMVAAYFCLPLLQTSRREQSTPTDGRYVVRIRNLKGAEEKAFMVVAEPTTWGYDRDIVENFRLREDPDSIEEVVIRDVGVDLALRYAEKDVWVAFLAKDYGMQLPRSAELLYQASIRLKKFFGDTLETGEKIEPIELAGQAGHRLKFKGNDNRSVTHFGECYMIAYNGMGFWLFVGAPSFKEAQQGLSELQENGKGFTLLNDRRGWREQPPRIVTFNSERYPLSMSAVEGLFVQQPNVREFDENCQLYLLGRYAREKKNNRKDSSVMVLVLPKQDNIKQAVQYARKYLDDRRQEFKDYKYTHVPITPEGEETKEGEAKQPDKVGNRLGRMLEMKVMLGEEPVRYLLLAVVNEPDAAVVFWCESIWEHRQIWREEFRDLLSSVNIRKKE